MSRRSVSRALPALSLAALACGLLVFNMVSFGSKQKGRATRVDTAAAVKLYLDAVLPPDLALEPPPLEGALETCRRLVVRPSKGIPKGQFWRVLPIRPFLRNRADFAPPPRYEDPGRSILLAQGFRLLGGVAPHLLAWLGVLVGLPMLAWVIAELWLRGQPGAATLFGLLVACSPYVVQALSLGYSPFGFYLVALLAVFALSAYATLARPVSTGGLLIRALLCGLVFALCLLCRSGTLLLVPGFVLGLLLATAQVPGWSRLARALLAVAALGLFAVPSILSRRAERHAVWAGFWEGLGDFDRSKGYSWNDLRAQRALREGGLPTGWEDLSSPEAEAFFRHRVLADIRSDPGWFAAILARRFAGTVLQSKLRPWGPVDGRPFAPSASDNEGRIDQYYRFTRTVDFLGLGRHQWELPISLLVAPTLLLAASAVVHRLRGGGEERGMRFRRYVALLGLPALAALGAPVLVTTASGLETQAFALVYFLGIGVCLDELLASLRSGIHRPDSHPG